MSHDIPILGGNTAAYDLYHPSDDILEAIASNPKSDSRGWGATPLHSYVTSEVAMAQQNLQFELAERSEKPPIEFEHAIPQSIQQYVANSSHARFTGRIMANYDNYEDRSKKDHDGISDEVIAMFERAVVGDASPAESLYVRGVYGIASAELGCITHPYGKNIELLEEMRSSVQNAIELLGGTLLPENQKFAVKQYDSAAIRRGNGHMLDALLMTRKRNIGEMQDGTIVRERSSFIVRIDEASGFDHDRAAKMRGVEIPSADWENKISAAGELPAVVPSLLEKNDFIAVIPLSTTTYAFNPERKAEIKAQKAQMAAQKEISVKALRDYFHKLA